MAVAEEAGVEFETLLYLKQRPDRAALQKLVSMLEDPVEDLVRKDSKFKALGLDAADYVGKAVAVVALLEEHIELLQRPLLVKGGKAIIGRPKDRIASFLSA